jgi:hypothetical protein
MLHQQSAAARGKKLLLINKRNRDVIVNFAQEIQEGTIEAVDAVSGCAASRPVRISGKSVTLRPFRSPSSRSSGSDGTGKAEGEPCLLFRS